MNRDIWMCEFVLIHKARFLCVRPPHQKKKIGECLVVTCVLLERTPLYIYKRYIGCTKFGVRSLEHPFMYVALVHAKYSVNTAAYLLSILIRNVMNVHILKENRSSIFGKICKALD